MTISDIEDSSATHPHEHDVRSSKGYASTERRREMRKLY